MDGEQEIDQGVRDRNPNLAAALSALIPGAGQWYSGRVLRALAVAAPIVLLAVVALLAIRSGPVGVLELAVRPAVLWTLLGVNVLLLIWRLVAVGDAYRLAGRVGVGRWSAVILTALVVFVAIPHVAVGIYGVRSVRLIDQVFGSGGSEDGAPVALAPPSPEADIVPDPATVGITTSTVPPFVTITEGLPTRNLIFRPGLGDPAAIEARPDIASSGSAAPVVPFEERVDADRLTFLIAGGDAGPGRGGLRTDTIMVATMDLATGDAALFGIPRNMAQIPMPKRFRNAFVDFERRLSHVSAPSSRTDLDRPGFTSCHCFPEQINALYPHTRKWTRSFPDEIDPGMAALREVVEYMTGLRIDFYVLVDMRAFVALVEAVGGVDVFVKEALQAEVSPAEEGRPWATVDVQPGLNHLSGTEALAYARARKGSSDYVRMQRQRCLLRAVAGEADPWTLLRSFPAIADAIEQYVVTDIPVGFLPDLVRAAATLNFDQIATIGFNPPHYAPGRDSAGHPIPDIDRIRSKVGRILTDGAEALDSTGEGECNVPAG